MAFRPLHLFIYVTVLMLYFESISSMEEDDFYDDYPESYSDSEELEAMKELVPRSPHGKRRRRSYYPARRSRRSQTRLRMRRQLTPRIRIRRKGIFQCVGQPC